MVAFVSSVGNVLEREFVIMVYVHALQDADKLAGSATKVKYFKYMVISIILSKQEIFSAIKLT